MRLLRALSLLLLAAGISRAAPGERAYLEEPDPAKAEKILEALLPKYRTPRDCDALLKLLRGKRAYPKTSKERETLDFACPDGKTRQFTFLLPAKYSPAKPVGLLVWLHGAIRQPPPGGGAGEAQMFRPAVEEMIVVGPSTFEGVEWGDPACRALVLHALDVAKNRFNVDENRVFLAGDSDGGRGTYAVAETLATFFGAAVPVIGSPGGVTRFLNLRNLPWFAINGAKDSIFDIAHVRESVEGMRASGIPLEWKLIEEGGHDPRFFLQFQDEVRAFLRAHPRDPFPKSIDWCVDPSRQDHGGGFPANTFRWLRIEETGNAAEESTFEDEGKGVVRGDLPRVSATREGNRITLRTRGVKRATVLVSDRMVDARKDLEIEANGRLLFRGVVAPDARAILEEARRHNDRTLVFLNRVTLDLDAPALPAAEPAAR